ncbi:TonB-dependent receptor [Novosphingobium sp. JCM 18896]|uniref:TonB-dependent receptor n=1 Tax=Novosphingobium sp. JCM 18896 TaxID=2989731 RepID=UPI002221D097|nr:TonB-dependent receptor [Novosphingobium sp. JCM 18896]MCW1430750.1 TonB-dependent receptor [Novosphingobium sp. JCM 18896]
MRGSITCALVATTALTWMTPALAQDEANSGAAAGDIIVTARRTEERLQDVPISMTVFNQEQVTARNIVSGNDLATYTPSLSANSRFGAETAAFAIRGFTQENFTSPSVATYFADVIGPRANGGTAGGNGAGVGQFFDLQNVQVLKGPQGTLFGRNTTGGAVLIVPQKPTDELGGYIEGSIGNFDMYRIQGVLNVPLADTFKVRLGFERQKRDGFVRNKSGIGPADYDDVDYWAIRGAIVADLTPDLENYLIVRYSESSTNGTFGKIVGVNAVGCDAGVDRSRYPLPGSSQVNLPGQTLATTASFLAPLACSGTVARQRARGDGFWDVESGNTDPFLKIKQWGVTNTTTWRVSDTVTLKNIASYQQFRQKQSLLIGNDNFTFPASPNPAWTGLPFTWVGVYPAQGLANVEQATFTEEFQIQGKSGDGKLDYVLGAYYERADPLSPFQGTYSNISYVNYSPAPAALGLPAGTLLPFLATLSCSNVGLLQCTPINTFGSPQIPSLLQNSLTRYWYENIGFFGQATYKLTDQLSLTGGIRYTIDKTRAEGGTRQLFFFAPNQYNAVCAANNAIPAASGEDCVTALPASSARQTTKRPTWLINLDYKPTDDVMLYAKYARGYRQGNINASNTIPQGWGPEKVESYEIGAKLSFRGDLSGYFNVAGFYNDFSDQQLAASLIPSPGSTASPAQAIVNAGKSRIQGFEVDALASYSAFSLGVGYTYLDTKLKSFTPVNFPGYLPATPNSDLGGPLPLSPKHKLTLTPSIRLPLDESVGKVTLSATYVHTSSQVTSASAVTPFGTVPAFDLLNLNLAWNGIAGSPIDLAAFVTNVTNEKYYTFLGGGWQSTGVEYASLGMPRMYGLRLKFRFGAMAD